MGLIKKNYEIKDLGLIVHTAYAKITNIHIGADGTAYAVISVQQSRDDVDTKVSLETFTISETIDKTAPIYEQLYKKAKEEYFADWEDDIVE